ncbi:D-hexose-6-phosphate mutarotase [Zophobihabitans entericus]|uniref:Putative glucose-6-phosphate 1-epimerase n=1 Tax=Zophobihabitans entericus TaxID=1635327 RepID=A0A6G9ICA6_9GAMM|nr:D-hexose-6-phosphate mutarotase [Zophobihabitans entericus]QIQ21866.1 D-hexose-6-phosphate mutarotase [Zophobihabitans entericus]
MSITQALLASNNQAKVISPYLKQIQQNDLPVLVVNHPRCTAAVSLHGGHLLFWQPKKTNNPVIWLSEEAIFKPELAIRGGVPVCWPWFNKLGGPPSHGVVRTAMWQLIKHSEDTAGVTLTLQVQDNAETRKLWNHAFTLTIEIYLGDTCRVNLSSQGNYTFTAALHTYLNISDIEKVKITGLGNPYRNFLTGKEESLTDGSMTFNQAIDRLYLAPEKTTLIHDTYRTIAITHLNAPNVVVWSPWQEGAASMQDMANDSYKQMVCVETGRIAEPVQSSDKETTTFGFEIRLI